MGNRETLKREVGPSEDFVLEARVLSTPWAYRITKYVMVPFVAFMLVKFAIVSLVTFLIIGLEIFGVGSVAVKAGEFDTNSPAAWLFISVWFLFSAWFVWEFQGTLRGLLARLKLAGQLRGNRWW